MYTLYTAVQTTNVVKCAHLTTITVTTIHHLRDNTVTTIPHHFPPTQSPDFPPPQSPVPPAYLTLLLDRELNYNHPHEHQPQHHGHGGLRDARVDTRVQQHRDGVVALSLSSLEGSVVYP